MKKELITFRNPKSPISETFRTLRTNIQFMNVNKKMKTILGTKVIINQKDSMKGKIEIEYYSPDELTRIYELIESIKK